MRAAASAVDQSRFGRELCLFDQATHRQGLGNTAILFEALKAGSIDAYPDYTGTIGRELLKTEATDLDSLNRGLGASPIPGEQAGERIGSP